MEIVEGSSFNPAHGEAAQRSLESSTHARAVAIWLFVCCALLLAMVVLGGVTRLTHSGLSITEWQPVVGALPPMNEAQWNKAFLRYQATPEYAQVNQGMSLEAFKRIFWWEYLHRLLGRVIGAAFLLPLLWFTGRRRIPRGFTAPLFGIFLLGALEGGLGWYMVKSGLVDDPRVSQLRLAAHLALALLIFGAMLWTAMSLLWPATLRRDARRRAVARLGGALVALVFVVVVSGGLVAGLRAGFAYNTFPLMNGHLVPTEILVLEPWYLNLANNMATVQFDHRVLAFTLALVVALFWWRVRALPGTPSRARLGVNMLLIVLIVQATLGVATLLLVVPLPLAAAHQAGAVLLFAAALNAVHALRAER